MAKAHIAALVVLFHLLLPRSQAMRQVKVGMLMTKDDPDLVSYFGYRTTASAVMIGVDRIRNENLLPDVNFTFLWYFDECESYLSIGLAARLMREDFVDIILGPCCAEAAESAGLIARFYDFPIIIWGALVSSSLSSATNYPTLVNTVPTAEQISRAFMELIRQFNWTQIAIIYKSDYYSQLRACHAIQVEIERLISEDPALTSTFNNHFIEDSPDDLKNLLTSVRQKARIIAVCLRTDTDRRAFMKGVVEEGMDTEDFVYVFIERRKKGFGSPPFWIDQSPKPDGMDEQIRQACRFVLVLDGQIPTTSLDDFNKQVIDRMKDYPFYCTTECEGYTEASSRAGFLADAMYLYGLMLNKTLTADPVNGVNNTKGLIQASIRSFTGVTGNVAIDEDGGRTSGMELFILNGSMKQESMVYVWISTYTLEWRKRYTDESAMWVNRGGVRPLTQPACGYSGTLCPPSFMDEYFLWIIIAVVLIVIVVIVIIITIYVAAR